MAGALVAGAAAAGVAAFGSAGITALMRSGEQEGDSSQEALKQLLSGARQGPSGRPLPVMDLHSHPAQKVYMFDQRFWKRHVAPPEAPVINLSVDLDSLVNGGVSVFLCTAYVLEQQFFSDVVALRALSSLYPRARHMATAPPDVLAIEHLEKAEEMVAETRHRRGDVIEHAKSFSDMKRIVGEGKVCMIHAMEGAHHLAGKIELVDNYFERGVCMMTVPHLYPNEAGGCIDILTERRANWWGWGSFSPRFQNRDRLTPWGHQLVEKLLDVGIVVDMTHGTPDYRKQILDIARNHPKKRPVTISHVDINTDPAHEICPSPEEIRAIADTGGTVGLMMVHHPVSGTQDPAETMLGAVAYLIKHGGEEVVALGSDFDGANNPKGLSSPRAFSVVRKALLGKFTEEQTAKFLFGNGERLLKLGWGKA